MRGILGFCILIVVIASNAVAQDPGFNPEIRFSAEIDPETGKVRLKKVDDAEAKPIETLDVNKFGYSSTPNETGFAYFDAAGELTAIYPMPQTSEAKEAILNQIAKGGSIKAVNMFGWGSDLPSSEEVRRITEDSINAALEMVCNHNPRPESMDLVVSVGVALGLEGKFEFKGSWRPQRDCQD